MKLNYKRTFFVGFAFFLICTFWQAYDTIIPKILTDKFGLSQTVSGAIMALDNILALFMLPLFGSISDKCNSKKGKRTPFILIGTVVACAVFLCMSFADNAQLAKIESVAPGTEGAQAVLYNADLTIKMTDTGDTIVIQDKFSLEEFTAIPMYDENDDISADYTNYVVPARQAYAKKNNTGKPFGAYSIYGGAFPHSALHGDIPLPCGRTYA